MVNLTFFFQKDETEYSLFKTTFVNSLHSSEELTSNRGRGALNSFSWSPAVKSLTVLILRHASVSWKKDNNCDRGIIEGEAASLASSLDYALSKQPNWLLDMFGADIKGDPYARRIISRLNPERKRPGPVKISVNPRILPPESISIYICGHVATPEQVDMLLEDIQRKCDLAAESVSIDKQKQGDMKKENVYKIDVNSQITTDPSTSTDIEKSDDQKKKIDPSNLKGYVKLKHFGRICFNDNARPAHPDVLSAIANINERLAGQGVEAYGEDGITQHAIKVLRNHFGDFAEVLFVPTGTAANIIALDTVMDSTNTLICADRSHIFKDECGALHKLVGCSITAVATPDAKLTVEILDRELLRYSGHRIEHYHQTIPRVISITQPTELGTVYTLRELKTLSEYAHKRGLLLHMDGARLINAATHLGCSLYEVSTGVGVDILSLGITKCGALNGNAIIFLNHKLSENRTLLLKQKQKQALALVDKTWEMSVQFLALFEDDLWFNNAMQANSMALQMRDGLHKLGLETKWPVESNAVFVELPSPLLSTLSNDFTFYTWDSNSGLVRFMTSFDTTEKEIELLLNAVQGWRSHLNKSDESETMLFQVLKQKSI